MNMKLTFVIPAYNEEACIGNCLESILSAIEGKDYDIEIIVVNNASTDKTKKIALSFKGVKVVDEPKKGLVHARKAGFTASSGDLIANIDADTILPSKWIDKVFYEFEKKEKLVALSGPYIYYDVSKKVQNMVRFFYYLGYVTYLLNSKILRKGAMLQGGNFVVRKSALEEIGGYNVKIDFYGEDTDIARRIYKVGKVSFTFKLPIYSSGRRLKEEGVLLMGMRYSINYFWMIYFKKPFTKKHKDIRK